ncbi:MAG TPA: UbiA family prenyltransferase [Planctomycetota bacterium]|nr:UbiA family prenyltransferase [Planctomycetota bacterium]
MIPLLRLVRLPNVFTALADIIAGFFLVACAGCDVAWGTFALLCGASAALYLAGMALNDFADREEDARVRPNRPIPSGAVSPATALGVGLGLLIAGVALALLAGRASLFCAAVLALAVLAYDFLAKGKTLAGPLTLGVCRFCNLLLGMSAAYNAPKLTHPWELPWLAAFASGLYGTGVTAFSAQEEHGKNSRSLLLGWIFTALGFAAASFVFRSGAPFITTAAGFVLLALLAFQLAQRSRRLMLSSSPDDARALVLAGVKGYCLLDAAMLLLNGGGGMTSKLAALAAVLMLFPGGWLRRWLMQREA